MTPSASVPGLPPLPPPLPLFSPSSPSLSSPLAPPSPPRRKIFTQPDLEQWPRSAAYTYITRSILRLVYAVRGRSTTSAVKESEATKELVRFLQEFKAWVAEVPLQSTPQRFGNKAFRDWVKRVKEAEPALSSSLLSHSPLPPATTALLRPELAFHLLTSLGSPQRLDYGTGHELSFLSFLCVLLRAGVFSAEDEPALVTRVFEAYLEAVREAQRVFRLEPAGSKGVWGLDDHQHLSYLFGASQLIDHPTLRPSSIPNPPTPAQSAQSLLHSSLAHLHTLKHGPFFEHSPLLHQISTTVPTWTKVTKGLWEMYKAEVLGKLPVVQHFRFGAGLPWTDVETGQALPSTGDGRADDEDDVGEDGVGGDELAALSGPALTPAPWASSSSTASSSLRPLPSSSSSSSSASSHLSHRHHPTSFPLPPHHPSTIVSSAAAAGSSLSLGLGGPAGRRTFAVPPPVLFPPRRVHATSASSSGAASAAGARAGTAGESGRATLADEGGAAAASSPFGVLPKARLGGGSSSSGGSGTIDGGAVEQQ
ncbi:hypothetical protein JCM8097_004971 [Rhodosporidiobolus ruineniae]